MLGKLTKYEFLATMRTFLPLYIALLVVSFLQGMAINVTTYGSGGIFEIIIPMVLGSLFIALVVITIMVMIRRFATMLGDEGYLMFTLPVSADSLLCSKLLIVFFWIVVSSIVGLLCIGIIVINAIPGAWEEFHRGWAMLWAELTRIPVHTIILAISASLMDMLKAILLVYFAIAIGHSGRFSAHKVIVGIVAYILLSTLLGAVESYLVTGATSWDMFFENTATNVFLIDDSGATSGLGMFNGTAQDFQRISMYMLRSLGVATAYTAALYAGTRYFISKKLNIE